MSGGRKIRVLVCRGPTCGDLRDSAKIHAELVRHVDRRSLGDDVILDWQSCFGQCQKGPNVLYREAKGREDKLHLAMAALVGSVKSAMHHAMTPERATGLLDRHLVSWGIRAAATPPAPAPALAPGHPSGSPLVQSNENHDKKRGPSEG